MTEISITIVEANDAIAYWLRNAILKQPVNVDTVRFNHNDNVFIIKLKNADGSAMEVKS